MVLAVGRAYRIGDRQRFLVVVLSEDASRGGETRGTDSDQGRATASSAAKIRRSDRE